VNATDPATAQPDRPDQLDQTEQTGEPEQKITWRMEMRDRAAFRPKYLDRPDVAVKQAAIPCPPLNRFFFAVVGMPHRWGGRHTWGDAEWTAYVDRPELETWVAYVAGTPAGYAELERQDDGSVRIECFGLLPQFVGQGVGAHLLSTAVARAWAMDAAYVWLTTCSHDHPHARANYQARGFRLAQTHTGPPNPIWTAPLPILGTPTAPAPQR
jgi:GNAT superfamily N-acetyltransferase